MVNPKSFRFDEGMFQHLLGMTAPPELWPYGIANVSVDSAQEWVEPVADRDPPDDISVDFRDEESSRDVLLGKILALSCVFDLLEILRPIETVVIAEEEVELFTGQFLVCEQCLVLIGLGKET